MDVHFFSCKFLRRINVRKFDGKFLREFASLFWRPKTLLKLLKELTTLKLMKENPQAETARVQRTVEVVFAIIENLHFFHMQRDLRVCFAGQKLY